MCDLSTNYDNGGRSGMVMEQLWKSVGFEKHVASFRWQWRERKGIDGKNGRSDQYQSAIEREIEQHNNNKGVIKRVSESRTGTSRTRKKTADEDECRSTGSKEWEEDCRSATSLAIVTSSYGVRRVSYEAWGIFRCSWVRQRHLSVWWVQTVCDYQVHGTDVQTETTGSLGTKKRLPPRVRKGEGKEGRTIGHRRRDRAFHSNE